MLNARTFELLQRNANQNLELATKEVCDKNECPAVLNQIWVGQILNKQDASDREYAKKHSLEIAFTPKLLSAKLADRSNKYNQGA